MKNALVDQKNRHRCLIGLDYGERRIGLAVAHLDVKMAFPRETLDRKINPDVFAWIENSIKKERADGIVVGMPYRPDGMEGKDKDVRVFIEELKTKTSLPIYTIDEAWSSQDAIEATSHVKKKRKQDKGLVDRVAASLFLQRFMEE